MEIETFKMIRDKYRELYGEKKYGHIKTVRILADLFDVKRAEVINTVSDLHEYYNAPKIECEAEKITIPEIVITICRDELLSYMKLIDYLDKAGDKEADKYRASCQDLKKFLFNVGIVECRPM